jgi:hypothetical protein
VYRHSINKRSFTRFITLFRLETDTRWQTSLADTFPFGKIRHLVVNMNHKEFGEVVIYQKSLKVGAGQLLIMLVIHLVDIRSSYQEVKKHNAAVKRKMQRSKKLEPTLAISHA